MTDRRSTELIACLVMAGLIPLVALVWAICTSAEAFNRLTGRGVIGLCHNCGRALSKSR